jgi:hypothetical protein
VEIALCGRYIGLLAKVHYLICNCHVHCRVGWRQVNTFLALHSPSTRPPPRPLFRSSLCCFEWQYLFSSLLTPPPLSFSSLLSFSSVMFRNGTVHTRSPLSLSSRSISCDSHVHYGVVGSMRLIYTSEERASSLSTCLLLSLSGSQISYLPDHISQKEAQ